MNKAITALIAALQGKSKEEQRQAIYWASKGDMPMCMIHENPMAAYNYCITELNKIITE